MFGQQFIPLVVDGPLAGPYRINDLCVMPDGHFAPAVDGFGIVYFRRDGKILDLLDRTRDPRITRVRRLLPTPTGQLWALLNDGIAQLEFPSRYTHFESLIPTGITSVEVKRFEGELWLLADGRVMRGRYAENRLLGFEDVSPPDGFTFSLSVAGDTVVAGTEIGAYQLIDNAWKLALPQRRNFRIANAPPVAGRWIYTADGEIGWARLHPDGLEIQSEPQPGFSSPFDTIADEAGNIWLEMGSGRLGRIQRQGETLRLTTFEAESGVPSGWVQAYIINGRLGLNVGDKLYRFDARTEQVVADEEMRRRFEQFEVVVGRPSRGQRQRLWVTGDQRVHVYDTTTEPWTEIETAIPNGFRPFYQMFEDDASPGCTTAADCCATIHRWSCKRGLRPPR